jgi:hypothetical protein
MNLLERDDGPIPDAPGDDGSPGPRPCRPRPRVHRSSRNANVTGAFSGAPLRSPRPCGRPGTQGPKDGMCSQDEGVQAVHPHAGRHRPVPKRWQEGGGGAGAAGLPIRQRPPNGTPSAGCLCIRIWA